MLDESMAKFVRTKVNENLDMEAFSIEDIMKMEKVLRLTTENNVEVYALSIWRHDYSCED